MEPFVTKAALKTKNPQDDGWRALMARAQTGDQKAYRQLLYELQGWLRPYFLRRLSGPSVDDLVQETLIAVHTRRATYNASFPFTPWLAAIAHNKWVDFVRKQVRQAEAPLTEDALPQTRAQDPSVFKDVNGLLERLPQAQARAIDLVKIQGYSVEEASKLTGQSASLVKVNMHRGLKKLVDFVKRSEVMS